MDKTPVLLTPQRLSSVVGVPADWLAREAAAGRLPHLRAGSRIYFNPAIVAELLRGRASAKAPSDGIGEEDRK